MSNNKGLSDVNRINEVNISNKMTAVEWLFLMMNNPNKDQEFANKLFEQAKQMEKEQNNYSEENMQEYVEFCIECLNQGLPPIIAKDWFNLYKNK